MVLWAEKKIKLALISTVSVSSADVGIFQTVRNLLELVLVHGHCPCKIKLLHKVLEEL